MGKKRSSTVLPQDDKSVENTNSDSLLSKLSVVSQGYRVDPFLQELCSDPSICSRRSPAINRGYLARLLVLEMSFERILILKQAQQVLSLGAGYDSMFFRLANMGILTKQSGLKYFEVDYTKSVLGKVSRISKSPLLKSVFSDGVKTIDQDCFSYDSGFLTLVGCNMTHLSDLEAKLRSCHFDPNLPTVILTECSTTYIEAEDCIDLMSWLTDFIRDFVFIGYEQIRPFDAFGRIMVKHFKNRNSAIKCVHHYPTVEDHIRRFKCFGWTSVEVTTIGDIWKRHIDSEAVNLINCEHFDEAAELMLKCSHYVLITAHSPLYTGPTTRHSKSLTKNDDEVVFKLRLAQQPTYGILNEAVTRFGHVTWQPQRNKIIVAGGYSPSQSRLCTMTCISSDLKTVLWTQRPTKGVVTHLFGSSCAMFGDRCFVFGGRGSPSDPSDLLLSISLKDCLQVETMITNSGPRPRWGHSLSCWPTSDSLFVIGGRDSKTVFQDIWQFDIEAEKWGPRTVRLPYDLYSHSTAVYKNSLIVTGGLKDFTSCQVNNEVLLYNPEDEVLRTVRPFGAYFGRFGHTSHVISDSRLILVGGVVSCPRDIVVSVIDLNSLHVVNFEANLRLDAPLVQHSSVYDKDRQSVIIFGGGTNCFSFGMHVNSSILSFSLE